MAHSPPIPQNGNSPRATVLKPGHAAELHSGAARRPARTDVVEHLELHAAAPAFADPAAPLPCVSGYEIEGVLGEGGMGVVYRAVQTALKRPVALKMIAPGHAGPAARQRFQTEAETVARLRHPNFVQIYEVGEHEGRPFLALELVEGGSLADQLVEGGPLPARDAAQLVATLAHAMHHAHVQGVVHRDLKPGNILLTGSTGRKDRDVAPPPRHPADPIDSIKLSSAKITDFGLAKLLDGDLGRTRSGAILGTPAYMAPEQARGAGRAATPAADIYSLGAILFECLTGRPPFEGESCWEVLARSVNADPQPPSQLRPRLSRDLDTICLKCLAKDPRQRYGSAAELADDLDRFAAGEAIRARPEGPLSRVGRRLRRRPVGVAAALLLAGSVALVGGFWELSRTWAESALDEGRELARRGDFAAAQARFKDGQDRVDGLPRCGGLSRNLFREWTAAGLRELVQQLMFRYDPDHLDDAGRRQLAEACDKLWRDRDLILACADGDPEWEAQVRADLRDVALRGLEVRESLAGPDAAAGRRAREEALARLDELAAFGAPSELIDLERGVRRQMLGLGRLEAPDLTAPRTATEYYLLGRALAGAGRGDEAERCFDAGLALNPRGLALHFDRAALAFRLGRPGDAIASYTACLTVAPKPAIFFSRRGFARLARADAARLAWERAPLDIAPAGAARLDLERARTDFEAALNDDPNLAEARLGRGLAMRGLGELGQARDDFEVARARGHPRARALLDELDRSAGRLAP